VHLSVRSLGISRCASDYARAPSAARLAVCIKIEWHRSILHAKLKCGEACNRNKDGYNQRNAMWLWNSKNHYCENKTPSLPQTCAEVSPAPEFECPICHILEHLKILLQSLIALCLAPGRPGSPCKYLEALVRATGVSRRFACRFWTDLHFADECRNTLPEQTAVRWDLLPGNHNLTSA